MRLILVCLTVCVWSFGFAAVTKKTYRIESQVYVDQKLVGKPGIVALSEKTAMIETKHQSGDFMKLSFTPKEMNESARPGSLALQIQFEYQKDNQKIQYSTNLVVRRGVEVEVPVLVKDSTLTSLIKVTVNEE